MATLLPPLVDTHAHVDYIERNGQATELTLKNAFDVGVKWVVNPCTHPDYFEAVIKICERHKEVYAAIAVHPTDVQETDPNQVFDQIESLLSHPKVVAIGETGLDYYHSTEHIDIQHQYFERFLQLAQQYNLPIIVHCRDGNDNDAASRDVQQLTLKYPTVKGVMHCFGGTPEFALEMIQQNYYISFAGNVTFKKAVPLQEAAKLVPLDKLLIETDSPFLSPEPFRGKPNEPARVSLVAEKIAALKQLSIEAVCEQTTKNAQQLFGINLQ